MEASAGSAGEAVPVRGRGPLSLCWNDCPFEPSKLAVGTSTRGTIIYSVNENRIVEECVLNDGVGSPINDVAWAPSMGRSYHLIATAAKEPNFKVYLSALALSSRRSILSSLGVVMRFVWIFPDPSAATKRGRRLVSGLDPNCEHRKVRCLACGLECHRDGASDLGGGRDARDLEEEHRGGMEARPEPAVQHGEQNELFVR